MTKLEVIGEELKRIHEIRVELVKSMCAYHVTPQLVVPEGMSLEIDEGMIVHTGDTPPHFLTPPILEIWDKVEQSYDDLITQLGDLNG